MNQVLGVVSSLTVIVLAVIAVCRVRGLIRDLKTEAAMFRELKRLCARPLDATHPAESSRLAVVIGLGRRFRPNRGVTIACGCAAGALATCAVFVLFVAGGTPPAADAPAMVQQPTAVRTVITTVTEDRPRATITRIANGEVTVTNPQPVPQPPPPDPAHNDPPGTFTAGPAQTSPPVDSAASRRDLPPVAASTSSGSPPPSLSALDAPSGTPIPTAASTAVTPKP